MAKTRSLSYCISIATVWLSISWKSTISQTCYDASTYCSNGWQSSPSYCNPSSFIDTIYDTYCDPNDIILWRNGIMDSASSSISKDIMIDYDFIICQEASFSSCGYVPLQDSSSSQCGEVLTNSGVIFGTGIDLAHQNNNTLSALGASSETLAILTTYYGLTGAIAAEAICNQPFTINSTEVYHLTTAFIDQYVTQAQQWYESQRANNTLSFMELPIGIRTIMTSIHWRWGHYSAYLLFWSNIITNNFQSAITVLRSWYNNGATDQRLSAEANVLEASLGCVTGSNNLDVVFLLDASGSVGVEDFKRALNWTLDFIQYFDASNLKSQAVRFGLATFSSSYTDHIYLDEYTNVNEYKKHILNNIGYDSASTYLGAALKQLGIYQFNTANGMREASKGTARLVVVLTDGRSSDDVDEGVRALSHLNLNIIAIGIGSYDVDELQQITISDNIYGIDTYTDLNVILSGITTKACHVPTQLNTENNAIVKDIVIQKHEAQYFEIYLPMNNIDGNKNIILNITQTVGCIYIYVSNSIQYPSYFEHDVGYTSCSQRFKQIVLAVNSTNIYISIEGRDDVDTIYDMNIGECNKTTCFIGSNYDPSLDDDSPYEADPISSCEDIHCNTLDDTLNIEITFSFNDNIIYNIYNMECFLSDTLQSLLPAVDSFGSCNIMINDINGGQIDALCQYPPCLWRDESDTTYRRRLNTLSHCVDGNVTMNMYTNSIQISKYVQQFKNDITESINAAFSDSFDLCLYAQAILHLLYANNESKETSEPQIETENEQQIYAEISPQSEVTEAPIFVVSMLLATVIFIWTSLHFICSGVNMCKEAVVGDFDEVKKGIWWDGRSKFMSALSLALIIWELADFILDLVATIGIFVKSGNPEIDSALYISCGVVSVFAFIASVLLFIGKLYLWKTFYPTINVNRAEKKENEDTMIDLRSKHQSKSIQYQDAWRKYYHNQEQIGIFLGHFIMYDLFGVSLEDCIQITVTWYIKQDLLFSGDSGFLTAWLWLTFIAALVSASVKVFRALLLN